MRVGIVGVGLIGGSLGLALHQVGHEVLGIDRNPIPEAPFPVFSEPAAWQRLADSDVIVVCTPLHAIPETLALLPKGGLVTDVGSSKRQICRVAEELEIDFVAGHPMAGTENIGFRHAHPEMFRGRAWVLVTTPERAPQSLLEIIRDVEAKPVYCPDPEAHDRAVAWVSHLPLLLSVSLKACVEGLPEELAREIVAGGYRDMTRLAQGNPELTGDILASNADNLRACFESFCAVGWQRLHELQ